MLHFTNPENYGRAELYEAARLFTIRGIIQTKTTRIIIITVQAIDWSDLRAVSTWGLNPNTDADVDIWSTKQTQNLAGQKKKVSERDRQMT